MAKPATTINNTYVSKILMTFDPDDKETYPRWSSIATLQILREQNFTRSGPRHVRGQRTNMLYAIRKVEFSCSCVCADDTGWTSCGQGLHEIISKETRDSHLVYSMLAARKVFDGLLAEAWQHCMHRPYDYSEYHDARTQSFALSPERWIQGHDLVGKSIWQNGYLYADLRDCPGEKRIAVFELNSEIVVHFIDDLTVEIPLPENSQQARELVFGQDRHEAWRR